MGVALVWTVLVCAADARALDPDWQRVTEDATATLASYIRIDSSNPPGHTVAAASFLETRLRDAGLATARLASAPEKPLLIARLPGRDTSAKPIVLLNHMDVVPADPARWSFPPFSGAVTDGAIEGRGALDMKGLAVAQLIALELLARRGERPRRTVVFLAVPDEEIGGGVGTAWLAEQRPDLLDAEAVWDEGGIGLSDVLSVPVLLISVTEKQVLWVRLVAQGPAGHGSRPQANAAPRKLVQALGRVLDTPPAPRLPPIAREVFRRAGVQVGGLEGFAMRRLSNPVVWLFADGYLQQEPWSAAMTRDTIAVTMLDGGYKPNVIPERASAVLDCRLLPDTSPQAFLDQLRKIINDDDIAIEVIQAPEPAPPSPLDNPLFLAMQRAAAEVYPGVVVSESMATGGTDSRFFRRRGTPAYGFFPILASKQLIATVHGIDERLPASDLGKAVQVIYRALRSL
jgi:acetylornithine deacetylase/succinyl-diaminopimelate desuccinylase-like protein